MRRLPYILIKIIQILHYGCSGVAALSNAYVMIRRVFFHDDMPKVLGIASAVVVSGSMEPEISVGDVVIVKEQDDYFVGDVIMFYNAASGDYTTHRIIEKTEGLFRTRGDNNDSADVGFVSKENIVGKVVLTVPFVGTVIGYVQNPVGLVVIVAVGVAIIFLPDLCLKRSKKGDEKEENSDSKEE